ncbi:hypothetical protein PC41400_17005 [Paenibacillus chitinolyticus]|uniref:Uncharacterized protein n=1 Tax=Paenibacillus chitinolyticus TaxID=79263 RepID=A0A410WXW7_9BACL|nr:hypothetical protein PC41400_17005 [Paenibacillus chitinolyticus]
MKQASLSKFSFKYIIKNDRLSVLEAYRIQVNEAIPNMNCPNRALKQKKKINCMQSFIPLKVAMDVFDKPTSENKQFMKNVDRFVAKLNF